MMTKNGNRLPKNANLDVEQPQITFGRRQVSTDEQAIIRGILEGITNEEVEEGMIGNADETREDDDAEEDEEVIGGTDNYKEEGDVQTGNDAGEGGNAMPTEVKVEEVQPRPRRSDRRGKGKRTMHTFAAEFQGDSKDKTILLALGEPDQEIAPLGEDQIEEHIMGVIMTQCMIGPGLARFQKKGEEVVTAQLGKLHNMQTFVLIHRSNLSDDEYKWAVGSLMFLKEKRGHSIQGWMVADGRKQQETAVKGQAASPTVCVESIFITAAIEAYERRDVATTDLPSAYLHAENNKTLHMRLQGRLAELMGRVEPTLYCKYISKNNKGELVLYVCLHKAKYGLLKSALLFYQKLRGQLAEQGFRVNPYDPCVANKWTQGGQLTVMWHVDDLKVSHKDPKCVTETIEWLSSLYRCLKEQRGKVHNYLEITLDYLMAGVVRVSKVNYIKEILKCFPEEVEGEATSPAPNHLFIVRDKSKAVKLPKEQAVCFHHTVAQLLFLSTRAQRDIQVAVASLTTRVKSPDKDDWGKLKRILKYLYQWKTWE